MKVLTLTSEYKHSEGHDVAHYLSGLAPQLAAMGHKVHILVAQPDNDGEVGTRTERVEVHHLSKPYPFHAYNETLEAVLNCMPLGERLVSLWESHGPFDLVTGHDWETGLVATTAQRLFACPLIATLHGTKVGKMAGKGTAEQIYVADMERWFVARADRVVAMSAFVGSEISRHYDIPPDKISVIPGGVAAESFAVEVDLAEFRSLFAEPGESLILFVGRLVPEKGPDVLLAAMESILKVRPATRCVFAGEGPMKDPLLTEAARMGISSKISVTGHLGPSVLGALYQVADVLALPSRYESYAHVALEGVLHDLPIVASQCGSLSELAGELRSTSFKPVVPGNAESLMAGILSIILKGDSKRSHRIAAQSRVPKSFTWKSVAERVSDLYESTCAALAR